MTNFKNFYVWMANTKMYMGLYFMGMTFVVGFIKFLLGYTSMDLIILIQILGVSIFTAVTQVALLPNSTNFSKKILFPKSIFWLLLIFIIVATSSYFGNWFNLTNIWASISFALLWLLGCLLMLVTFHFEQERDSLMLNESLERYKADDK